MKRTIRIKTSFLFIPLLLLLFGCSSQLKQVTEIKVPHEKRVILGLENFLNNHLDLIKDKRIGLVTNPSGVNHLLQSTADLFAQNPVINLAALFGP